MKTFIIAMLTASVLATAGPFAVAVVATVVFAPTLDHATTSCTPTLPADAAATAGVGVGEGSAPSTRGLAATGDQPSGGFALPPADDRLRKASLNNPPTPIPAPIETLYRDAAAAFQLPWTLLAGIGMAETNHGRLKATSSAGAQGLMQFMPATFASYGTDGDGDGDADIRNDADSIFSAANYLTASGAHDGPDGTRSAVFAYNRAQWYVNDVLFYAHAYGGGTLTGSPTEPCTPTAPTLIDGEIPQSDRNVGSEYRLTVATVIVKRAVAAMFPTITTIGGWRASSKISTSDHPHGKGLDVMISNYRDPAQIALGDAICDWLIANHEVLNIKYLIWRQQSWSPQRPYWRPMADRGSDTDNHYDHVHISVLE
ncbi:lytic transglycosylase domain-containing protein [Propioniciclava soli]|uniref:lytic transglycosylase domain-containing protein n=1 Tax=Propioniciclava soli TaxID=2775081 RepID=UPI001E3BD6AB|nr:lytic transglycosylase domain-containing protein [Propioniciclava soli]